MDCLHSPLTTSGAIWIYFRWYSSLSGSVSLYSFPCVTVVALPKSISTAVQSDLVQIGGDNLSISMLSAFISLCKRNAGGVNNRLLQAAVHT